MEAISRSANLTLPIRDRKTHYVPGTGIVEKVEPAVSVRFEHSGSVPEYLRDAVVKMVDWGRGLGQGEDPFERCGYFNTDNAAVSEGWDEATKKLVEDVLEAGSGSLYVVAAKAKAAKPWPNYDKIDGTDEEIAYAISRKVTEDGYDPKAVAQYERENGNKALVLEALDFLVAEQESDVLGVIPA